ncbi:MAG: polysaccharide biosynthesis tyrosine autokinase [Acidobacteriota bacterium]
MKLAPTSAASGLSPTRSKSRVPLMALPPDHKSAEAGLLQAVWRRKWLVLFLAAGGAFAGALVNSLETPLYPVSMTIEFSPEGSSNSSEMSSIPFLLNTQVEHLRSRSVLNEAIRRLSGEQLETTKAPSWWERVINVTRLPDSSGDSTGMGIFNRASQTIKVNRVEGSSVIALTCKSSDQRLGAHLLTALYSAFTDREAQSPSGPVRLLARVLDPPELAGAASESNRWPKILGGLVAGGVFGLLLILPLRQLNDRIESASQARRIMGLPMLGIIPAADEDDPGMGLDSHFQKLRIAAFGARRVEKREAGLAAVELATALRKPSHLAESFRSTLSSLLLSSPDGLPQVVLVTSPSGGEGKTTIACNLAVAAAEMKKRVLLIDAHLRRPRVHSILSVANSWGLSDVLADSIDLEQLPLNIIYKETRIPRLSVLPSGPAPVSVVTLFHSGRFDTLLQRLRREFDLIVVDGPPILELGGARLISRSAAGVILALRADHTLCATALEAVAELAQDKAPLLGLVWNSERQTSSAHS